MERACYGAPGGELVTPEEFAARAGARYKEQGIRPYCQACGEQVEVWGLHSPNVPSRFDHRDLAADADPLDDCVLANRGRFRGLEPDGWDDERGRIMRARFFEDENLQATYSFCLHMCGQGNLSAAAFRSMVARADRKKNTRWALLAVVLVGGLSVAAVQLVTAHGLKASDQNLREVSGRIDAARMVNWHAEASARAVKAGAGSIPREVVGVDWLDPNGFFASATDGSGRVVTWFQGGRSEWPQIAQGLVGLPHITIGRIVHTDGGIAFEADDGSIVRLPAGVPVPEGAPAITGKAR